MVVISDVPLDCINQAAIAYQIPATVIISVLKTEGGRKGEASPNKNGTYDYGPMQINDVHIKKLSKYGITRHDIQYDPCINVAAGTWLLAQSIASGKDIWHGTGNYHSHTEKHNQRYRQKVKSFHNWITSIIAPKNSAM